MDENCLVRSKIVEKSGNKIKTVEKKENTELLMFKEYFKIKVKYSSLNGLHSRRLLIDKW